MPYSIVTSSVAPVTTSVAPVTTRSQFMFAHDVRNFTRRVAKASLSLCLRAVRPAEAHWVGRNSLPQTGNRWHGRLWS